MTKQVTPQTSESKNVPMFLPLGRLHKEIDSIFQSFASDLRLPEVFGDQKNGRFMPDIDVHETDKTISISAELPGVDESDIDVELENEMLTISGEKRSKSEEKEDDYYRCERTFGSFSRSISLPAGVDEKAIKAKFDNGVLDVTVQKPVQAKRHPKKVEIQKSA